MAIEYREGIFPPILNNRAGIGDQSMKRVVVIIIVLLVGVGVLAYPAISNYVSQKNGSYAIQEYEVAVVELNETAIEAAWDEAEKYNESLAGQPVHDPFLEGTGMAMLDNYNEILSINERMGYVEIPKISVKLPVYHGTSNEVLQNNVGHLEGSSMPIGGAGTHSVLTGHTGLTHAKIFTDLIELEEGDLFYIHVLNKTLVYKIDQIKVIEPDTTDDLRRADEKDYCTLLTCTPYAINSHRLLVRGERTEYIPEEREAIKSVTGLTKGNHIMLITAIITSIAMVIIIIIVLIAHKRNLKKQDHIEQIRQDIWRW